MRIGKMVLSLALLLGLASAAIPAQAETVYSARTGDTVQKIASRFNVSTDVILKRNADIKNASVVLPNKKCVYIPDENELKNLQESQASAESLQKNPPVPNVVSMDSNAISRAGNRHRSAQLASRGGAVLNSAHRYMGTPYVFGATGNGGFDCSGFVMRVFQQHGIYLPRTADVQYNVGTKVARGDEQPGDLVFFETYLPGPSHVGIYVGNGNFIHASSSRGVTTSNLNQTYYAARYLGAKRVLK